MFLERNKIMIATEMQESVENEGKTKRDKKRESKFT